MEYLGEPIRWQPRDRSRYWMNRAKDVKDGILSSLFVIGVAGFLLTILYFAIYVNPDYIFTVGILIVAFYAVRTIVRDIFEWL